MPFEDQTVALGWLEPDQQHAPCARLTISIFSTDTNGTRRALEYASSLAKDLECSITLIAVKAVPYPLSLDQPRVQVEWTEHHLRKLLSKVPGDPQAHVYLCRDYRQTLCAVLPPHSLVVVGGRKHWWPTNTNRLVAALRRAGHQVIFAESE